jgi:hypothetical protein
MPNYLEIRQSQFRKGKATAATTTSFPSKVVTTTRPTNDGVHVLGTSVGIVVVPYGTGDANDVFEMHILLWRSMGAGSSLCWVPTRVSATPFICTLGTFAGSGGASQLATTDLICDTITNTDATLTSQSMNVSLNSPADNTAGYIVATTFGAEMIEFIFDTTTGDPTGANCLWALL